MADQRGQIVREEFIESFQSEFPSLTSYLKEVSEEKDSLRITRLESVIQELRRETDSYRKLLIQAREEIVARDDEITKLRTEYQQQLELSYTEFHYFDQYCQAKFDKKAKFYYPRAPWLGQEHSTY